MAEEKKLQALDAAGLDRYTGKLVDGTLEVGKAKSVPATGIVGEIPLANLPAASLERVHVVANDTARLALTTTEVQNGDTVKVNDTQKMYFVKDDTKLGGDTPEEAFEEYAVGEAAHAKSADNVPWSGITNKPATFEPSAHNQASDTINGMTGYKKGEKYEAIQTSDTLNTAVGKLEAGVDENKKAIEELQAREVVEAIPNDEIDKIIARTWTAS